MAALVQVTRLLAVIQLRVAMILSRPMVLVLLDEEEVEGGLAGGVGAEVAEVEEDEAEKAVNMSLKLVAKATLRRDKKLASK